MTQQQVEARIAEMKAKLAQQRKRHSVELVEAKPMTKKALAFARAAHQGQKRKYDGADYIDHPIEVANILIREGITDERVITVALLHDVYEDCLQVPKNQLAVDFNFQIHEDVTALTKPSKGSRQSRIDQATKNAIARGPVAVIVKIADIMSNISDVALHDAQFASIYLEEKKRTLDQFKASSAYLTPSVKHMLGKAYDTHGEALNQLALTVVAEENQRVADEAESKAEIEAILYNQAVDQMAEIALF